MAHSRSFRAVESIGRTLPDVEVTTAYGQPALKVRGKMFVCIASHKSAEPLPGHDLGPTFSAPWRQRSGARR